METSRADSFVRRLLQLASIGQRDVVALQSICAETASHGRGTNLVRQGDRQTVVHIVLKGWAARYKVLENGARQILSYVLPGDFCDARALFWGNADYGTATLTTCDVASIPVAQFRSFLARHPKVERALWAATLAEQAVAQEWLVNIANREAGARIAHLFCELAHRLEQRGLLEEDASCVLPLTQADLADSLGLTSVHVSRTLKRLKEEGLVAMERRLIRLLDPRRLSELSGFDTRYLRLAT